MMQHGRGRGEWQGARGGWAAYGLRSSKSSGIAMGSPMRTGAVRFVIDSSRPPDLVGVITR